MRKVIKSKTEARKKRALRVRSKLFGTATKPRLAVTRSLQNIYLQLIDDEQGRTLFGLSSRNLGKVDSSGGRKGKVALAYAAGLALAKKAQALDIKKVCFDRRGNLYHGRVLAVAEGARDGGLKF